VCKPHSERNGRPTSSHTLGSEWLIDIATRDLAPANEGSGGVDYWQRSTCAAQIFLHRMFHLMLVEKISGWGLVSETYRSATHLIIRHDSCPQGGEVRVSFLIIYIYYDNSRVKASATVIFAYRRQRSTSFHWRIYVERRCSSERMFLLL
jgi:hypothetical protein